MSRILLIRYTATKIPMSYLAVEAEKLTDDQVIDAVFREIGLTRSQIKNIDSTRMADNIIVHLNDGHAQKYVNIFRPQPIPYVKP